MCNSINKNCAVSLVGLALIVGAVPFLPQASTEKRADNA